jgi:hypothetical protein
MNEINFYQRKYFFEIVSLILFSGSLIFVSCFHEMWRDEMQAWLIATHAHSLSELYQNTRYEFHPMGWFVLLWLWHFVSANPESIKVLNGFIAVSTVSVLLFCSPFTRAQKVMMAFGYYLFFEYGIIARNYLIGVLLLFLICSLWNQKRKYLGLIFLLLLLLCQTNIFALFIALSLAATLAAEFISNKWKQPNDDSPRRLPLYLFLFLAGVIVTIKLLIPPLDYGAVFAFNFHYDWARLRLALGGIGKGLFPIPPLGLHCWNSYAIPGPYPEISLFVGLVFALFFWRDKKVFLFFLLALVPIFAFFYSRYDGHSRHYGHYFLIVVVGFWLFHWGEKKDKRTNGFDRTITYLALGLFNLALLAQVYANAVCVAEDLVHPFSNGKNAAAYVRKNYPDVMLSGNYYSLATVSGYLRKDYVNLLTLKLQSFYIWKPGYANPGSGDAIPTNLSKLLHQAKEPFLFITNWPLEYHPSDFDFSDEPLQSFTGAMQADEDFYLYLIKPIEK